MSKSPGRPRKQSPREPNGRPQRETVFEITKTVGVQRCVEMGWKPTDANIKKAVKASHGTIQGKLLGMGLLSSDEANAADLYQIRDARYRSIRGLAKPTISAADLSENKAGSSEDPDEQKIMTVRSEYEDVQRVVKDCRAEVVAMSAIVRQEMPEPHDVPRLQKCLLQIHRIIVQSVDRRRVAR